MNIQMLTVKEYRTKFQSVIMLTCFFLSVILALHIGGLHEVIWSIILCFVCTINGFPIYRRCLLHQRSTLIGIIGISFLLGVTISVFFIACILLIIGWNLSVIFFFLLSGNAAIIWYNVRSEQAIEIEQMWDSLIPFFLLVVILSIFFPLWNVGELTPQGYAFPSLFGHDLLYRIGFTAHVARGLSDESFFMYGQKLPYHYLFYIIPATIYKAAGQGSNLLSIFRFLSLVLSVAFVSCLFEFFRSMSFNNIQKAILGTLALFSYSLFAVGWFCIQAIKGLNLFGLAETMKHHFGDLTIISHGWYRDFLVEPHAVSVISIFIICFMLLGDLSIKNRISERIVVCGFLLAVCFGIDSFLGALIIVWYLSYLIFGIWYYPSLRKSIIYGLIISGLIGFIMLALYMPMGIFNPLHTVGKIFLKPYKMIIILFPVFLIVEYGSMSILCFLGILYLLKEKEIVKWPWFPAFLIILICFFFIFLTQHIESNVVQRKAGKIIQVGFLVLSGAGITFCVAAQNKTNYKTVKMVFVIILVLGIVSFVTDIYVFSNNRSQYFSSFIHPQDYKAIRWVIENTPESSIVQSLPEYRPPVPSPRESYRISLFSQIGERKMALGDLKFAKYSQTPDDTVFERRKDIIRAFETNLPEEAWAIANKYRIDYIYIGTYERSLYPKTHIKLHNKPHFFKNVYHTPNVDIFKILK